MSSTNKLETLTLTNVNLGDLKQLFGRSLLCDSKLGFTICADGMITSYAGGNSFFKKWSADLASICEKFESTCRNDLKVFIYDGTKFCNQVLSAFGQTANITFFFKQVQKSYVCDLIEVTNDVLKIKTMCSPIRLGFVEISPEDEQSVFNNTTNVRKLTLTSNQLKTISKFGSLNMLGKAVEGIELRTTKQGLIATDGSFSYVLDSNYEHDLQPITINKSLMRFIDDGEIYDVTIATTTQGRDVMTLRSTEHDLIMAMALMVVEDEFDTTNDSDDLPFEF